MLLSLRKNGQEESRLTLPNLRRLAVFKEGPGHCADPMFAAGLPFLEPENLNVEFIILILVHGTSLAFYRGQKGLFLENPEK